MKAVSTIIIGAGHAGLAMSASLAERSIDHVILERGEVANSWATERWDSLRLLTPNWQSRLPGFGYEGDRPDDYRDMAETIAFIRRYAEIINAPIETDTNVTRISVDGHGYRIESNRATWRARSIVLASGACNVASVPAAAAALPQGIQSMTPMGYRNPSQLAEGGVMIVGASATGAQLAHEIQACGRQVTLSAGEHIRAPRVYRGQDIQWWMDVTGVQNQHYLDTDDINRARKVPSLQLAGWRNRMLDLNSLRDAGVNLIGRFAGINNGTAQFSGSLKNHCAMSDLKMNRLLKSIDEWASANRLDGELPAPHRFEPTRVDEHPRLGLDLRNGEIRTIIWATGYRPDYSWLDVDVFDRKGRLKHDGGIVDAPGLYVMGLPFLRRRKSTLIDGAGDDARDLGDHLAAHLLERGSRMTVSENLARA